MVPGTGVPGVKFFLSSDEVGQNILIKMTFLDSKWVFGHFDIPQVGILKKIHVCRPQPKIAVLI